MPIYEYTCDKCGDEFEFFLRGQEKPACPKCGGMKLRKRFSVPAAHTAGSSAPSSCPRGDRGGCGAPDCSGNRCDLSAWQ